MTWVTNSIRLQALNSRKQDMSFKLLQLSQRLMDLQQYGANIADGLISDNEAGALPRDLFMRQSGYMSRSASEAYSGAKFRTDDYLQRAGAINQGTGGQYTLAANGQNGNVNPGLIFNENYKTVLREISDAEKQKIQVEEKKIEQEKLQLETQLKAVEAEYESVQKAVDDDIKKSAIKLA